MGALPSQPPQQPDLMEEEEETVKSPEVNCSSLPAARLEQSPPASSRKTASQLTANARRRSLRRRPSTRPCKTTIKQPNVTLPVDVSISSDKHPSKETQAAENTKKNVYAQRQQQTWVRRLLPCQIHQTGNTVSPLVVTVVRWRSLQTCCVVACACYGFTRHV